MTGDLLLAHVCMPYALMSGLQKDVSVCLFETVCTHMSVMLCIVFIAYVQRPPPPPTHTHTPPHRTHTQSTDIRFKSKEAPKEKAQPEVLKRFGSPEPSSNLVLVTLDDVSDNYCLLQYASKLCL